MIVDSVFYTVWHKTKTTTKSTVKPLMWMRMVAMKDQNYNTTTNDSLF